MAPVLAVPVINRPDLFGRLIDSIDIDVRLLVIDNSGTGIADAYLPDDAWLIEPPRNLGVAASWNLAIKSYPFEPFWLFANADTEFAPGDLARLVSATEDGTRNGTWGWVGITDWRAFGLTADTVDRVGLFDENFVPIYCEDADYERRCDLAGVRWGFIDGGTSHVGSVVLEDHRRDNDRTYPENVAYYAAKWGVSHVRAEGGYDKPWGKHEAWLGQDTAPTLSRLRRLSWPRDDRPHD